MAPCFAGRILTIPMHRRPRPVVLMKGSSMNINWKLKSSAFRVIDMYSLYSVLFMLQKYVTRRARVDIPDINKNWLVHRDNLSQLGRPLVLEFGAGKNLAQNIYLSDYTRGQFVVDIVNMLDIDLFNEAARKIAHLKRGWFKPVHSLTDIRDLYNISYRAPYDVSRTDFDDDTFDACVSTNTLEHIPRESLVQIFTELRRIIRPGGLISAIIDYSDHYAHTDRSISRLNFLSFSDKEFSRYNHKVHYQNRLRHYDYEEMFADLGFELVRHEALNKVPLPAAIANMFRTGDPSLPYATGCFLLKVRK